jgi:hypothetical protein
VSTTSGEAPKLTFKDVTASATKSFDAVKSSADHLASGLHKDRLTALAEEAVSLTAISRMDHACLKCHDAMHLHQPQADALHLRSVLRELSLVHTGSCAVCHREHVGAQPMKLPGTESCASCHNDRQALARTREVLRLNEAKVPKRAENRDVGDGVIRFLAPPPPEGQLIAFKSYAEHHPPFAYEQPNLRDPAVVHFNHWRHEQSDIPLVAGRKLDCTDCHRAGANGIFYQRVNFEEHCQTCHSLHIDPDLPKLAIPHGDVDKVRAFLSSIGAQYVAYFRAKGIPEAELRSVVTQEFEKLKRRISSAADLERRVFTTGDPPGENERISPRTNKGQFFPPCAKCHEVQGGDGITTPKITPTNIADRWVHRGPFTHVPHQHMQCTDCHGAALQSKLTSDILMPPQTLCAQCHRPFTRDDSNKPLAGSNTVARADLKPGTRELADAQRREGGVKSDCQSCHSFHAPPAAAAFVQAQKK